VYLIVNPKNRFVLIDAGMPNNSERTLQFLASKGFGKSSTLTVLLTHPDIDHAGSLADLKRRVPEASIGIHELDAATLAGEKGPKQIKGFTGLLLSTLGELSRLKPVKADLLLKDGDEVEGLTVIHTPGHTDGSSCFYDDAERALFAGDALRTDDNGNPQKPAFNANDEQAMDSLRRICALNFEKLYPGHGAPIIEGASEKLAAFGSRQRKKEAAAHLPYTIYPVFKDPASKPADGNARQELSSV